VGNTALLDSTSAPAGKAAEAPAALVPFVRASRKRTELAHRATAKLAASSTPSAPISVPASGFLRHLVIEVKATGGAGGGAVAKADGPFSVLQDLQLADVNGNPLFGPLPGYHAYLASKYGAYEYVSDAKMLPSYSAPSANGNFAFTLRIPVEISGRDGLGSLANMNAGQTYKLRYSIAAASEVFSTAPATLPDVEVSVWLETWAPPREADPNGAPQETRPPAHGTTQYWSSAVYNIGEGEQTIRLTRTGNLLRTIVAIVEGSSGRSNALFPEVARLEYDGTLVESIGRSVMRDRIASQYGLVAAEGAANGLDAGVYVWCLHHDLDGRAGFETRTGYMATSQATRLDLRGVFAPATDRLTILTNDVAVPVGASHVGA